MKLYNKDFDIFKSNTFDFKETNYIVGEGTRIPINIENISGFLEHLYQCGFSDSKRIITSVFVYITDRNSRCSLNINYSNSHIHMIPEAGVVFDDYEVEFLLKCHNQHVIAS